MQPDKKLNNLRRRVQNTDLKIIKLLIERFRTTYEIQALKRRLAEPLTQRIREASLLKSYLWLAQKHKLPLAFVKKFFRLLFSYSKKSGIIIRKQKSKDKILQINHGSISGSTNSGANRSEDR